MPALPPNIAIDLNSDMGEGFGAYRMGDDEAILDSVTSANVACGFHGGDPEIMARTYTLAKAKGVTVGAHPGYPDLWGFGRRDMAFSLGELERLVAYQIGAALAVSTYAGHPIRYVKCHGALGQQTYHSAEIATAVCRAVKAVDPSLVMLSIARGQQDRIAAEMGLITKSEIYADRGYDETGFLVSRKLPGALLKDPVQAAERIVRMVREGAIETTSGVYLPARIESVCVHSDTPGAVEMAAQVRTLLEEAGLTLRAFA
ncbi:5-oxoprolinase subunit PxpA [Comamonadaceae bacterium PP-2]